MPLTWQDVVGRVEAPDFSNAASLITQGIAGIGDSVKALVSAPDQRRQADLAKQAMLLSLQQKGQLEHAQMAGQLEGVLKTDRKEKDIADFGAAQSILEAGIRKAVASGQSMEDYLAGNEVYANLSPGARAYGASHLSDAAYQGEAQLEQQRDNARQEAQFNRSFAQQEAHFRAQQAMQAREMQLREAALKKTLQEEREAKGLFSMDPNTNIAIRQRMSQTTDQLAPIMRGIEMYGKMSPREAAKKGGVSNLFTDVAAEAQQLAASVERATGKKVDSWMINQLLAEGGGADNVYLNPRGGFDQGAAEDYLKSLVGLQEAALYNQQFLDEMVQNARAGKLYSPERLRDFPIRTGIAPSAAAKARGSAKPPNLVPTFNMGVSKY